MRDRIDYVAQNRAAWQGFAADYVEPAEANWRSEPAWGIWGLPEAGVGMLAEPLVGKACVELGCGAGYVSAWIARRGGHPVGIDPTPNQLATARRLQSAHDLTFPLIEAIAEQLPFPDDSFDFAISEYGAALWADPYLWIPEAARVLRAGAALVFMTNSSLAAICAPDADDAPLATTLQRPYIGLHRTEWTSSTEIEFHLPHGEWLALLAANGFAVERLLELGAPPDAVSRYAWANVDWAQRWPTEEVWFVRKSR